MSKKVSTYSGIKGEFTSELCEQLRSCCKDSLSDASAVDLIGDITRKTVEMIINNEYSNYLFWRGWKLEFRTFW